MRLLLFCQMFLCACFCAFATAAYAQRAASEINTFNYVLSDVGRVCLPISLGSGMTASLMMDTGSPESFISEDIAQKLKLETHPALDAAGRQINIEGFLISETLLTDIRYGSEAYSAFPIDILPRKIFDRVLFRGEDGIFGWDELRKYAIMIDPTTKQITLWHGGNLTPAELKSVGMDNAGEIKLIKKPYEDYVLARYNNKVDEKLKLDTGSLLTSISSDAVHKMKLKPEPYESGATSMAGVVNIHYAKLDTLFIGQFGVHNITVFYADKRQQNTLPPLLGISTLLMTRFVIDGPGGKIYIKSTVRAEPSDKPAP